MTTFTIAFPDELLQKINDYRFSERIETKSAAIKELINAGLKAKKQEPEKGKK